MDALIQLITQRQIRKKTIRNLIIIQLRLKAVFVGRLLDTARQRACTKNVNIVKGIGFISIGFKLKLI